MWYAGGTAFHAQNVWKRQYKRALVSAMPVRKTVIECDRKNSGDTALAALWFREMGAFCAICCRCS